MKKLFFLILLILMPQLVSADVVEINGIWYGLVNNSKVKIAGVTKSPNLSSYYSGTIDIPAKVTYDGIEYDVTSIGSNAFSYCLRLTSITIPNSVESIGSEAFLNCSGLSSITISNRMTSIGSDAFKKCDELTSVHITDLEAWCNIKFNGYYSNPLFYAQKLFLNGVELKELVIPNSVTFIGNAVFCGCNDLTSVTIPNSVISIGDYAFYNCRNLLSVTIPNNATTIGKLAFSGCSSLFSVTIPNSMTSIGDGAFSGCSGLTSINVEAENTKYDSRDKCNAIIETETNTLITGCQNTIIPNSVTSIGDGAFLGCSSLTSITIPNSVTSIGDGAFLGCSSLTSITIPNSVTSIGWSVFSGCSGLKSITIPYSVSSIEAYTFDNCSKLSYVTIGSGVTRIGGYSNGKLAGSSFGNCPELTDVTCLAENVPSTYSDTFIGSYIKYATLHVPNSSVDAYKATEPWSNFMQIVPLEDGDIPETLKCAKPTISLVDGKIIFSCETKGVEYVSEVTVNDAKKYYDSIINSPKNFKVTVYATKDGYDNSETTTAEFDFSSDTAKSGDVNGDGEVNVADHVKLSDIILNKE